MKQTHSTPTRDDMVHSGIQAWLDQTLDHHSAVVVRSSSLSRGYLPPQRMNDPRVDRIGSATDAVLNASGRLMGGQDTALLLEGRRLSDAIPSLEAAKEAGLGMMATLWPHPEDVSRLARGLIDAEIVVLAASSLQETLDLSVAAARIAAASAEPCVVLGSVREGAWTLGHFETVQPVEWSPSYGRPVPRVDPFNPSAVGLPMTGRMVLKRQAGRLVNAPDLDRLIEEALEQVSALTGRQLSAFSGADTGRMRMVLPACIGPSRGAEAVSVTQIFPVPGALLAHRVAGQRVAVVLPAGPGSDLRHPLVRAFDAVEGERRRSGFFRREVRDDAPLTPLAILVDPAATWTSAHTEAVSGALDDTDATTDLRVLDARLGEETRVPAIEEAVHAARARGLDPTVLDLPLKRSSSKKAVLLIGARHPHTALALATRILDRAEAGAVAAPLSAEVGGDALVIMRLAGVLGNGERPRVLLPDTHLIGHRALRHHLPERAFVVVPDSEAGHLPRWLLEKDRTLLLANAGMDWSEAAWSLPESNDLRPASEDDLLDLGARPPEELHDGDSRDTDRDAFLRTLGHLQDMDRLDEAPVDDWILSATAPSLVPRPNRWANDSRPLPAVIAERCSGCAACWTVCPETAITARAFRIEELVTAATDKAPGPFVHLPRLTSAWISTAHSILKKDDLGQYRRVSNLLSESLDQLLTSAGATGSKAAAIRAEAASVMDQIGNQEIIRTDVWFGDAEKEAAGSGNLLAIQVNPAACTHCGLCVALCPEEAIQERKDVAIEDAFRQLDALPVFSSERMPFEASGLEGTLLTGPSASASFRAGSIDRGNLNRTVIRMAVETHGAAMRARTDLLLEQLDQGLQDAERAMDDAARDRLRINDFESFGRQLEAAAGNVSEVLQDLLDTAGNAPDASLNDLASVHRRLKGLRTELMEGTSALCVVNSLDARHDGLAPFPSNPFGTSALTLPPEKATSVIPGLLGAWQQRLEGMAACLRQIRQLRDGTLEPDSSGAITDEDRSWAVSHLPRILWIVDYVDNAMLGLLRTNRPVHLCWLDGGPTLDPLPGLSPVDASALLPDGLLTHLSLSDPVSMLTRMESSSAAHQAVFHVYAPDPTRDGVDINAVPDLIKAAAQAGISTPDADITRSLADWMIRQERFRSHFTTLARTDWSSDQVSVGEWLRMDAKARTKVQPCVVLGAGTSEERWVPDQAVLARSESWWHAHRSGSEEAEAHAEAAPEATPTPGPETQTPEPTVPADAHALLTERLLALSGFQSGGTSLQAFIEANRASAGSEEQTAPVPSASGQDTE